jgi:hypothetical protein
MNESLVAVVRYEKPVESVQKAFELSCSLDHLPSKAKVLSNPTLSSGPKPFRFRNGGRSPHLELSKI